MASRAPHASLPGVLMLNLVIGLVCLAIFVALLSAARARNGEARITSVWAAQSISLVLVCVLMAAGGFLLRTFME